MAFFPLTKEVIIPQFSRNRATMTISSRVQQQFFASPDPSSPCKIIRLPLTLLDQIDYWSLAPYVTASMQASGCNASKTTAPKRRSNLWTAQEHERFLRGLELFPKGPWRRVAAVVRTKTTRQTMTHAQKYRQKIERHQRVSAAAANKTMAAPCMPRPTTITLGAHVPLSPLPKDNTVASSTEFKCLEIDPVLQALIDSLEPIDNPDAWTYLG